MGRRTLGAASVVDALRGKSVVPLACGSIQRSMSARNFTELMDDVGTRSTF